MTVGIGEPASSFCVAALNCLQNSGMLTPRWPSAGPIGGEGLACPAGTWSLMYPSIFFIFARVPRLSPSQPKASRPAHIRARPESAGRTSTPTLSTSRATRDCGAAEGAAAPAHLLAALEGNGRLRPLDAFLHLLKDAPGFLVGDRNGLVLGAEKAGHFRRLLDQMVGLVVQLHL